jgi:lisH domain-containing protein FOPNL
MTTVEELKNALKETLEQKGVLNEIRAKMRQSIFEAIESDDKPQPKLSNENLIINALIKEYLDYNNYLHTASVFQAESGQPKLDRNFITSQLNIIETNQSQQVPLLYSLIFGMQKQNENLNEDNNINNNNYSINNPLNSINQNNQ